MAAKSSSGTEAESQNTVCQCNVFFRLLYQYVVPVRLSWSVI